MKTYYKLSASQTLVFRDYLPNNSSHGIQQLFIKLNRLTKIIEITQIKTIK